jgi:DNA-binding HxlR family transcriptional regulator
VKRSDIELLSSRRIKGGDQWRRVEPTSPPAVEYSLIDLGHELIPAIETITSVYHDPAGMGSHACRILA